MQVRTASGVARINGHDLDQVGVDEADYCVAAGGCGCPKGKTYQGPAINRSLAPTKPVPAIALSGGQSGGEVEVSELPIKCNRTSNTFHLSGDVTTTLTLAGSATCQNGFSPDDVQLFMTSSGQPAIPPREPSTLSLNLPGNGTTTFPSSSAAADLAYNPNGSVPNAYYWGEGLSPGSATNTTGTITIHGGGSSGTVNLTLPVILDGKQGQASTDETISGSWNCSEPFQPEQLDLVGRAGELDASERWPAEQNPLGACTAVVARRLSAFFLAEATESSTRMKRRVKRLV